jgi:hypothetical protein
MNSARIEEPEWLFPFDFMQVGDSFFVPTLKPAEMIYKVDTSAKRVKIRVKIYPASKDGCLGVRVWRVG